MLSTTQRATVTAAVPSFAPRWSAWLEDQRDYVARFPEEALSAEDESRNFLWELGAHLADRFIRTGADDELAAMFAAFEPMLASADAALVSEVTLSLFEQIILSIDLAGKSAASIGDRVAGPETARAWEAAWKWMHPQAPMQRDANRPG